MKKYFILPAICAMLFASCAKDLEETLTNSNVDVDPVTVALNLSVSGLSAGTEESELTEQSFDTRTSTEENDGISSAVANLLVMQFDGTSDDSKIVAYQYIDDLNGETTDLTLLPLGDATTIVSIANSFNAGLAYIGMSMSELKGKQMTVATNSDNSTPYGSGLISTDNDINYFIMSSYENVNITGNNELVISLIRNVAKITITLENSGWTEGSLTGLTLYGLPNTSYYFNSYIDDDTATPFPSTSSTIGYLTEEDLNITSSSGSTTFTYYVPVNLRGTMSESTTEETKPIYAPTGSTYAYVDAQSTDGDDKYGYKFYLGANLTTDFNLKPNHHYGYTFTFNSAGDATTDHRVENMEAIDYTAEKASNCYIINPSSSYDKSYIIPIAGRITEFWGSYSSLPETISLNSEDDWDFEVLWYDCDACPLEGYTDDSGAGTLADGFGESGNVVTDNTNGKIRIEKNSSNNGSQQALKITISTGFTNWGNVVVAVYDNRQSSSDDKRVLWSWHLWLTDYNPDSSISNITDYENYGSVATVESGEIHRYVDYSRTIPLWGTDGIYEDKYIMDRNIGATGNDFDAYGTGSSYGLGNLYFQFGRKDPFPGTKGKFLNGDEYNSISTSQSLSTTVSGPTTLADAVENPMTYFYYSGNNWCSEETGTTYLWNDKNISNISTDDSYGDKSIFDPSPLGWKLPVTGIWSNFSNRTGVDSSLSSSSQYYYPYFPWYDASGILQGRIYGGFAYFPASGYRSSSSGGLNNGGSNGYNSSASPNSETNGYSLLFYSAYVTPANINSRAGGFPARPIQE